MTSTPDPALIAKGLSEAQRRFICGPLRSIGRPTVWIFYGDHSWFGRTLPTRAVLTRLGLLERGRFGPTALTLLGEQVRAAALKAIASQYQGDDHE